MCDIARCFLIRCSDHSSAYYGETLEGRSYEHRRQRQMLLGLTTLRVPTIHKAFQAAIQKGTVAMSIPPLLNVNFPNL